jgi:NhaA family Na+:H+ antiporter
MMVRLSALWAFIRDNSLLLIAGALAALVWANTAPASYARFAHALHFAVNDIGMVFFFALAVKEILEARLPGGPLESTRQAAVPLLAALGGMAIPAGLYLLQCFAIGRPELYRGWAIPTATDIAFSYLAARLIFPKGHPAIPFLLLLAIADDALGLILLAVFYPSAPLSIGWFLAFMIPALATGYWLNRRQTLSYWPYVLLSGGLSWAALFYGGFHPALALVPILPFMPHGARDFGLFADIEEYLSDTLNRFEHDWKSPVQVILLFFGLVNAGVTLGSVGQGSWIVLLALLIGKPLGITLTAFVAVRAGLRVPGRITYVDIFVVGIAAAVGFTVALFFATAAFPAGWLLDEVKMGALMSFVAAPLAVIAGRLLRVSQAAGGGDVEPA